MNTRDLDNLLDSMAEPLPRALDDEARRVAESTMPPRMRRGRAPRARWWVPVLVTSAVVLTAGAGTAAITMSHWGGVSMPLGNVRNSEPIPVNWTTESGHQEECRVWIELRNPHPGDQAVLDAAIVSHDWSGLGQQIYDAAESLDADGESTVGRGLEPIIQTFVDVTFPGIHWLGDRVSTSDRVTDRAVDAWGMTCAPETQ